DTATTEIYTLSLHDALPICATRLIASVAPRTKTISLGSPAFRKPATVSARRVEAPCRAFAQCIDPAMHVRVIGAVELGDTVDYGAGLLRARRRVEKHQAGVARENRELRPQRRGVE